MNSLTTQLLNKSKTDKGFHQLNRDLQELRSRQEDNYYEYYYGGHYRDKEFDIVTCRTAAHHFLDVEKFCSEVHRVLKDEGEFIIVDTITSDQIKLNNWHQEVELIRDKSHIKNLSLIEWKSILKISKFSFLDIIQSRVTMNLNDWMERSGTSDEDKKILKDKFQNSNEKIKRFFGIKILNNDISFYWPVGIFHLKKLN